MTKHLEYNSASWLNKLLNLYPLCVDEESIKSFGVAWLFKENGKWKFLPRVTPNDVQFYNAILMVRLNWLPGLFIQLRWSGSQERKALLQLGFGWKLIGRIALQLRIQSDKSSEVGFNSPNLGQSKGWEYGPH